MRKENGIMYHIGDIGELSADARPMSVERRSGVGRASADARPILDRRSVEIMPRGLVSESTRRFTAQLFLNSLIVLNIVRREGGVLQVEDFLRHCITNRLAISLAW